MNQQTKNTLKPEIYFLLSEFNLPILLWYIWRKRRIAVINIVPIIPFAEHFLKNIVSKYHQAKKIYLLFEDFSDQLTYRDYTECESQVDPYPTIEPWLEKYYDFDNIDSRLNYYALAYKHSVCNYTRLYPFICYILNDILNFSSEKDIRLFGVNSDIRDLFKFMFDRECGPQDSTGLKSALWLNTMLALGYFGYSFFWIIWRTRWRLKPAENVFLGSDLVGDTRLTTLWSGALESGKNIKVIVRSKKHEQHLRSIKDGIVLDDWPICLSSDGRFSPISALSGYWLILKDFGKLFRHLSSFETGIFLHATRLPFYRIKYRALFARFTFKNYWGRDDYNTEHIIRSQELRRIGGRHFGILHGQASEPPITPVIRYIDFDVYYVFGYRWYEKYYKSRWPKSMEIRIVGSSGMTRQQLERLKDARPNNIVCYVKGILRDNVVLGEILKISHAFPDRKVILKPKGIPVGTYRQKIDEILKDAPANLIDASGRDSYDVLFECSYALSESSTTVIETIQFGLVSFAMIMDPKLTRNNYYYDFPDLVHENAASIIDRIRAIESGDWTYNPLNYRELVDLSGRVIWDVILSDLGVENIDCTPLEHLNFLSANKECSK